jgi:hypothetical protein
VQDACGFEQKETLGQGKMRPLEVHPPGAGERVGPQLRLFASRFSSLFIEKEF